jgi:predicted nucleotidyltransferase component of viral defense system
MIPAMNIIAWGNVAPWTDQRQVEQDLMISRAIVELFADDFLKQEMRFRGGTALNKLHFPAPLRYSEDIDLVRTTRGRIKPILSRVREILEPWLGDAAFEQSRVAPKLIFRVQAEDGATVPLRMKVEINTRETEAYDKPCSIRYAVENPWFTGESVIPSYSREEMLATKMRALLQRDKGRDLFDLSHALAVFDGLDTDFVIEIFQRYLAHRKLKLSRAQAEERMFAKLRNPGFLADIRPLLAPVESERLTNESMKAAFVDVFKGFVEKLPGNPWARTNEMTERFQLDLGATG